MEQRDAFEIGEEETLTRVFTEDDIELFAKVSGDYNPIHINANYARSTPFGGCIVHGMLVASLISSILGNKLPGPGSIYIHQDLQFSAPVRPGDQVTARVIVTNWDSIRGRITLSTQVINQNNIVVISGEARLALASYIKKR